MGLLPLAVGNRFPRRYYLAIEVFGDRWSLLVLRDIIFGDRRYFRELQANSIEGIASTARSPSVRERLNAAYLPATNSS